MIKSRRRLGLAAVCVLLHHGYAQSHVYAVRDDIAMVRFNDPSALARDATAKFSPDEKYFAIVTSKGVISSDQIESTLSIFRSDESEAYLSASACLENAPAPWASITLAAELTAEQAEPYGSVITELRWSTDSQSLYFVAESHHAMHRVYRLDVHSRKAIALTPENLNVIRFDFANGVVVCSAWRVDKDGQAAWEDIGDRINLDARAVTGESLKGILFPNSQPIPTARELWTVREHDKQIVSARVAGASMRDISWLPEAFAISPAGHYLIQLEPLSQIPDGWSRYEPAKGSNWLRFRIGDPTLLAANSLWRPKEYSLIDLKDGSHVPLVHAPHAYSLGYAHSSEVIWSADERRVLLTNTFLPLDGVDGADREKRFQPCAVTDVELPSRESHCVIFMSDLVAGEAGTISDGGLSFGIDDDEISVKIKHPTGLDEERRYIFESGRWRLLGTKTYTNRNQNKGTRGNSSLRVGVRQGLNEPPTLWVTNISTGRSKKLWDPNPQFANLELGQASVFRWKDKTGYEWKGGLVRPVGYVAGKRYPLVIQIYNFDENLFLTDGLFPTAMVARPLASDGIVALQIQRKIPHTFDMAESAAQLAGIESAIDELANDGLVDPDKVGLVGFSATCWYVENALIMDPTRFRAATIADGSDISYMQYHLFGVSAQSVQREYETIIGAKPIGVAGFQQWLDKAPGFNLDRIVSPVRLEAISPSSVLSEWELYSSLRMQGKPVDLIYFPTGQHIHQKPLERLESQQGDVDWFRFWLQGYKDPDPAKRDQYQRWESMSHLEFRIRNNGR